MDWHPRRHGLASRAQVRWAGGHGQGFFTQCLSPSRAQHPSMHREGRRSAAVLDGEGGIQNPATQGPRASAGSAIPPTPSSPNARDRSKSAGRLWVSEYDLIPQTRRAAMRLNQKRVPAAAPVAGEEPSLLGEESPLSIFPSLFKAAPRPKQGKTPLFQDFGSFRGDF